MSSPALLEMCVDSVESAAASEKGGAQRIELCSDLAEGGVTPSAGLIAMTRKRVKIPLHVLIRPRAGDFLYSADEFEVMKRDIVLAKHLGANGVVVGILDRDGNVDVPRTGELVALAQPLPVTFSRAFDLGRDQFAALEDVISAGADRILTSGGAATAEAGSGTLARLVQAAAGRVGIIAAGGIREHNVDQILRTGVSQIHASLRQAVPSGMRFHKEEIALAAIPGTEYRNFAVTPESVAALLAAAAKSDG
jgi:copper homeostasis protein